MKLRFGYWNNQHLLPLEANQFNIAPAVFHPQTATRLNKAICKVIIILRDNISTIRATCTANLYAFTASSRH